MKKFICIALTLISLFALSSCVTVVKHPLNTTTFEYNIGPKATYYVRPYEIKFVDMDDTILTFDVVSGVELINTTKNETSYDVKCTFFKHKKVVAQRLVKDTRVNSKSNKIVKIILNARDTSVNGYRSVCKVKVYRLR